MTENGKLLRRSNSTAQDFEFIADEIVTREGSPVDYLHIVAALESMGYSDTVIRDRYGGNDSFTLAKHLFPICSSRTVPTYQGFDRRKNGIDPKTLFRCCFRGMLILFPVFLSLVTMAFHYGSAWGHVDASPMIVNSFALSLIVSMIIAGGFGRTLALNLERNLSTGNHNVLRRESVSHMLISLVVTLAFSLLLSSIFEHSISIIVLVFNSMLLTLTWMGLFILYVIRKEWLFVPIFSFGVASALALRYLLGVSFTHAQAAGTITIALVTATIAIRLLPRGSAIWNEKILKGGFVNVIMKLFPAQFFFGVLYFSLLFTDRFMNWISSGSFAFDSSYEVSLDIAMFSLLIGAGILEYQMTRFWKEIMTCRRAIDQTMSAQIKRFFIKSLGVYQVASLVGVGVVLVLTLSLEAGQNLSVVLAAALSYTMLAWGSFACNLYTSFTRCTAPNAIGLTALTIDLIICFWAIKSGNPEMTVVGLLAASLFFFLAGSYLLLRISRDFPYLKYTSA